MNVGADIIDLTGFRLEGAVEFDFSESEWKWLGPGEVIVAVRDMDAFARRYDVRMLQIVGTYGGHLSDGGERIRLLGRAGEPLLDFAYDDRWYPETDGGGYSLVIREAGADPDSWGSKESWAASEVLHGTPGVHENLVAGGRQRPGDANGDGRFDIADPIRLLGLLFAGTDNPLPCAGSISSPGNVKVLDANGDGRVDLADAIHSLNWLYAGGRPHVLGADCVPVEGCPDLCAP